MHLPDKQTVTEFTKYYLLASIPFVLIYGSLNYWTAQRTDRVRLFLDWESDLPFVPGFIYGYLSIMLIFLLPLFSLRSRHFRALCIAFVTATIIAGLVFAILPAETAQQRTAAPQTLQPLFGLLHAFDLPHNLFPSLHITYATLILLAVVQQESCRIVSIAAGLWMLLICLSVILIRQHHLIDIVGGWLLGWAAYRFVFQSQKGGHTPL